MVDRSSTLSLLKARSAAHSLLHASAAVTWRGISVALAV